LYNYGDNKIKDRTVAVIAGGGNDIDMLEILLKQELILLYLELL